MAATVAAWWQMAACPKRNFGGSGSALGSTAAVWQRQQKHSSGSVRSAVAGSLVTVSVV